MKKALYLLPLLLLPVLLVAGVFQDFGIKHLGTMLPHSTAYRLQNEIYSEYQEDQSLLPRGRRNVYYNPNNPTRVDSLIYDIYDPEFGEWGATEQKVVYSYNAAGMVETTTFYVPTEGLMRVFYVFFAKYDSQNRLVRLFSYMPINDEDRDLVPKSRLHIVYGAGTTFEVYDWLSIGDDNLYYHNSFQYDAAGRITQEYEYSSADSINWVENIKTETTYHPQDTSTGAEYISFISYNIPLLSVAYYVELPGNSLQELEYQWVNGAWMLDRRMVYTYDDQFRKISSEDQYFDGAGWLPDYRQLFYYDDSGNLDYFLWQGYLMNGNYEDLDRYDYTWETYTANSDLVQGPIPDLRIKAYPVPFAGELSIIAESKSSAPLRVGIYNQRGQLVSELSGLAGTNLSWDGRDRNGKACSSGIYFLRASQGSIIATAKIVKLQ